ncbi:hypothetical protein Zm00014a_040695, partial [Zea mays]
VKGPLPELIRWSK